MAATSGIEIHIHGVDNHVSRFVQKDPRVAADILAGIHPSRVFAQPSIVLKGDTATTVFPCSAVARLDVVCEDYPGWPFHRNVADAVEITEGEFRQRYDPTVVDAIRQAAGRDALFIAFVDITLANSDRVFAQLDLCVPEGTAIDRGILLQQILTSPVYHMRRRGGGAVLINPANIVRLNMHPGPRNTPNAWPAQLVEDAE